MSDNQRDEIGELVHRYSDAVTRRDGVQWSSCWADDASWALSPSAASGTGEGWTRTARAETAPD